MKEMALLSGHRPVERPLDRPVEMAGEERVDEVPAGLL